MVGVAQLVEHLVVVQDVAGSSPVTHPKGVDIVGLPGDARTPKGVKSNARSGNDRRGGSMTCYRLHPPGSCRLGSGIR
jgi:hypothetical protein